ncbi:MAG: hypothetical protein QXT25_04415 [Candidatus Anstonellaceae archaeon]
MNKAVFLLFLLFFGIFLVFAQQNPVEQVKNAAREFCKSIVNLVAVVSMLMIVFAGVVYAGGQMMGAETRARANVWATAALVGAVIGILIIVVAPPVISYMYRGNATSVNFGSCSF